MNKMLAEPTAVTPAGRAAPRPTRRHVRGNSERLAARARRGDRAARARLVEEHMGLVRAIAHRYRDLGLPVEDLVQEGAIGLLDAIDDYDSSRGANFSTYAFWRVRAAVTHALSAHGQLVRLPRPVLERRRQVAQARERLASTGREPSPAELATETTLTPPEVAEALAPIGVASLDRPVGDETVLGDLVAADPGTWPEAQVVRTDETRAVRRALRRLGVRKRAIISRHFGLGGNPETLIEIADDLDLSPERTRALKDEALRELAAELEPVLGA